MIRIENFRDEIQEICRTLKVKRLDLVGSAARSDFNPDTSDIDILIEFDGNKRLFDRYFKLKEFLEKHFGRRIDIIQKNAVKNPYVRENIERDRVHIYGT